MTTVGLPGMAPGAPTPETTPPPSQGEYIVDHVVSTVGKVEYPNKWTIRMKSGTFVNFLMAREATFVVYQVSGGQMIETQRATLKAGEHRTVFNPLPEILIVQESPRPWWAWMAEWLPGP